MASQHLGYSSSHLLPRVKYIPDYGLQDYVSDKRSEGAIPAISKGRDVDQVIMARAYISEFSDRDLVSTSQALVKRIISYTYQSVAETGDFIRNLFTVDGTTQIGSEFKQSFLKASRDINCELYTLKTFTDIDDLVSGAEFRLGSRALSSYEGRIEEEVLSYAHLTDEDQVNIADSYCRKVRLTDGSNYWLHNLANSEIFLLKSKSIARDDVVRAFDYRTWNFYRGGQIKLFWATQPDIIRLKPATIIYVGGAPGDWVNYFSTMNKKITWICVDKQSPVYNCIHIKDYVTMENQKGLVARLSGLIANGSLMVIWDVRRLRTNETRSQWNAVVIEEWALLKAFLGELSRLSKQIHYHIKVRPFYDLVDTELLSSGKLYVQAFNRLDSHEVRQVGIYDGKVGSVSTKELIRLIDEFNSKRDDSYTLDLDIVSSRLQSSNSVSVSESAFLNVPGKDLVALFSLSNYSNLRFKRDIFDKVRAGARITLEYGGLTRQGEHLKTNVGGRVYHDFSVDILDDIDQPGISLEPFWHLLSRIGHDVFGPSMLNVVMCQKERLASEQETVATSEYVKLISRFLRLNYFKGSESLLYTTRRDVIKTNESLYGITPTDNRGGYVMRDGQRGEVSGHLLYHCLGAAFGAMNLKKYLRVIRANLLESTPGDEIKNTVEGVKIWHRKLDYLLAVQTARRLFNRIVTPLDSAFNVGRILEAYELIESRILNWGDAYVRVIVAPMLGRLPFASEDITYIEDFFIQSGYTAAKNNGFNDEDERELYESTVNLISSELNYNFKCLIVPDRSTLRRYNGIVIATHLPTQKLMSQLIKKERPASNVLRAYKKNVSELQKLGKFDLYDTLDEHRVLIARVLHV
jgi:23S rRNA U2552 (ribose-2'-O)-methylase RlmE/FtsJ